MPAACRPAARAQRRARPGASVTARRQHDAGLRQANSGITPQVAHGFNECSSVVTGTRRDPRARESSHRAAPPRSSSARPSVRAPPQGRRRDSNGSSSRRSPERASSASAPPASANAAPRASRLSRAGRSAITRTAPRSSAMASATRKTLARAAPAGRAAPATRRPTRCRSPSGCPSRREPAPRRLNASVEQRGHDHPAERGHDRQRGAPRVGELART